MMVKPLAFKGDKKPKKRKHHSISVDESQAEPALSLAPPDLKAVTKRPPSENIRGDEDDNWVTAEAAGDVVGPVVLVLPSDPPTCIACDANGTIFTSEIENLIEKNPGTAEPHDVRQVWVASRIAGIEGASFKGHHGKYVTGCLRNSGKADPSLGTCQRTSSA